jgi:predicted metalloprotease
MPRRVAWFVLVVVFAGLALAAPAASLAQSSPEGTTADLDAFWAAAFADAGIPYSSPSVVALSGPVDTPCGPIDPAWGPGAYCTADETIYYSVGWFDQFAATGNGVAGVTVLAHEWGHHVQLQLGVGWTPSSAYELQADCLAGAYAQDAEARGLLPAGALAEAIRLAALSGDLPWLPNDAPEHGSGAERALAFMRGYQGGIAACGIEL